MNRTLSALLVAVVLAACTGTAGGSDDPVAEPPPKGDADGILQIAPGIADGPGVSIDDAVGQAGIGPLLINGALFVAPDGSILLCSAIAESFPPQCGGTRLLVRGLDPATMPDLQEANGVRWAEQVQLLGTVALIEG